VGDFVAGDTLYVTLNTGQTSREGVVVTPGVTMLYALAHVLSGGGQPQLLATLNGSIGGIVGANTRLIALGGSLSDSTGGQPVYSAAVWDLALHTLVTFPTVTGVQSGYFMNLAGTDLAVEQGNETVLFFHTSTLPTTPTGG
jgi:hypothetical protein